MDRRPLAAASLFSLALAALALGPQGLTAQPEPDRDTEDLRKALEAATALPFEFHGYAVVIDITDRGLPTPPPARNGAVAVRIDPFDFDARIHGKQVTLNTLYAAVGWDSYVIQERRDQLLPDGGRQPLEHRDSFCLGDGVHRQSVPPSVPATMPPPMGDATQPRPMTFAGLEQCLQASFGWGTMQVDLAEALGRLDVQIDRGARVGELECIKLTYEETWDDAPGASQRTTAWVAPSRGYRWVRHETLVSHNGAERLILQRVRAFQEIDDGEWFPAEVETLVYERPAGGAWTWRSSQLLIAAGLSKGLPPNMNAGAIRGGLGFNPRTGKAVRYDTSDLEAALREGRFPVATTPPPPGLAN